MESTSRLVVAFLLNAAWQVTLVFLLALLLARLLRAAPARYLHGFWVMTLGVCLLLPAASLVSLRPQTNVSAIPVAIPAPSVAEAPAVVSAPAQLPVEVVARPAAPPVRSSRLAVLRRLMAQPIPCPPALARAITLGYGLFLLFVMVRLGWAWRRKNAVLRGARARPLSPQFERIVTEAQRAFGVNGIRILWSPQAPSPLTAGLRRPIIVLPECLLAGQPDQVLTAVLAHEMAHIQRRDFFFNLVFELVLLPLSFHPAALALRSRIARTREQACDEIVAGRSIEPPVYAQALLDLARLFSPARAPRYSMGACDTDVLEERLMRIMKLRMLVGSRRTRLLLVSACVAVLALGLAASAVPLRIEQAVVDIGPPPAVNHPAPAAANVDDGRPDSSPAARPDQTANNSASETNSVAQIPGPTQVPPEMMEGVIVGIVKDSNGAPVPKLVVSLGDQNRANRTAFKAPPAQQALRQSLPMDSAEAKRMMEQMRREAMQFDQVTATNQQGEYGFRVRPGVYYVCISVRALTPKPDEPEPPKPMATQGVVLHPGQVQRLDFTVRLDGSAAPAVSPAVETPAAPVAKRVKVGGLVQASMCIDCTPPAYPSALSGSGTTGRVMLWVEINTEGLVADAIVLESTAPEFAGPALEAVRKWRYRPTKLNNEPVWVDTTITVAFDPSR